MNVPTIEELIAYIEAQTGITFIECDCFNGLREHGKGEHYYNLLINDPYWNSREVMALERLALNSSVIYRIEPNGLQRVAVFLKNDS